MMAGTCENAVKTAAVLYGGTAASWKNNEASAVDDEMMECEERNAKRTLSISSTYSKRGVGNHPFQRPMSNLTSNITSSLPNFFSILHPTRTRVSLPHSHISPRSPSTT